MNPKTELGMEEMEKVTGGVLREVNTGIDGLDAAFRQGPMKSSKQIGHLPNGTVVDTVSDELIYDPVSKRNFVQITFNGKTGWIAASLVGLKR